MTDNRQVLDNLEAYVRDKLSITRSLHDRLGLTENSLQGAQMVTVATVQSDQLTTRIPNNSPNNTEIDQQDDNDYPDDRQEYLYQVDGTLEDRDKIDKASRTKSKRPTAQPEENSENIDDSNSPRPQKSKGKASLLIKSRVQKRIKELLE